MATKMTVECFDDLDGTPGARTVKIRLDRVLYEVDLSPANETALRSALGGYMAVARVVKHTTGRRTATAPATPTTVAWKKRIKTIRAWALEEGLWDTPKGRIPGTVIEKYNAVHSPAAVG